MMRNLSFSLTLFFFFQTCDTGRTQTPYMWQLTDVQGLPAMTVYQLLQDKKGYIWIGTQKGLYRYDGRTFKSLEIPDFLDNEIILLKEDIYGRIWFTNLSGQIGWTDGTQAKLFLPDEIAHERQPWTFEINKNNLWIYYPSDDCYQVLALERDSSGNFLKSSKLNGHSISYSDDLYAFKEKVMLRNWYFRDNALHGLCFERDGITHEKWEWRNYPPLAKRTIFSWQCADEFGRVYISSSDKVGIVEKDTARLIFDTGGAFVNKIFYVDNVIWILTSSGGYLLEGTGHQKIWELLPDINVNCVMKDREGAYWIGTQSQGIFIIPDLNVIEYFGKSRKMPQNDVNSLFFNSESAILYAGLSNGNLLILHPPYAEPVKIALPDMGRVTSIHSENPNEIWIGCDHGFLRFNPGSQSYSPTSYKHAIKKIMMGPGDSLWLAESHWAGYMYPVINNSSPSEKSPFCPVVLKRSYGLCRDYKDRIWIGSVHGVYVYERGKVSVFHQDQIKEPYKVSSIIQGSDSSIWVGTSEEGIFRIKNDRLQSVYNEENGLISNNCTDLFAYGSRILIGTDNGLNILDSESGQLSLINESDGLPSDEIRAVVAGNDYIWIGTTKGLIRFPEDKNYTNTYSPPIYISGITINGRDTSVLDDYRLRYKQSTLDFHFTGLSYKARGKETYRYRLKGLDNGWNIIDTRTARFHTLPPGDYEFQVQAINEDGMVGSALATSRFSISTPWWKTAWFYSGLSLGLALSVGGIVYWRQNDLRKREKVESDLKERIHALRMEALRAQMNPHFIYNALNAIQDFVITKEHTSALFFLSRFANMVRLIFDYSQKEEITLAEEIEFLELYLELEKLRFGDRVNVNFHIDEKLEGNLNAYDLPPLLIQPVIENAFKHGLMHRHEGGLLDIQFKLTAQDLLKCTISDNGVGRKKAAELNAWRQRPSRSGALKAIKERLDVFHSNCETFLEEYLVITDIKNEEGSAAGTRVEIFLKSPKYQNL